METLEYLFPILAALAAIRLWNTEYRAISLIFAGDFVILFGITQFWIDSSLPGGVWFLKYLGIAYILLFGAYLTTQSKISYCLAGLSAVIGVIHCANPILLWLTIDNYQLIMTIYCLLQFLVFSGGIGYEVFNRHIPLRSWFNPRHSWHKGA